MPSKGANAGASWSPKGIIQDFENNDMGGAVVQFRPDQEPAIVQLRGTMHESR